MYSAKVSHYNSAARARAAGKSFSPINGVNLRTAGKQHVAFWGAAFWSASGVSARKRTGFLLVTSNVNKDNKRGTLRESSI